MKATGIIRRVDELGRVVIPIEIRNQFNIVEKDPIEIYVDDSSIILKRTRNESWVLLLSLLNLAHRFKCKSEKATATTLDITYLLRNH